MTQIRDMVQLEALRRQLTANPRIAERVAARVAPMLSQKAQEAFDAQRSPEGVPWGVGEDGTPLDLNESGRMRAEAIKYTATGTKVRATVGAVPHAKYQLKHGVLPKTLPAEWAAEIDRIAQHELAAAFGGRR